MNRKVYKSKKTKHIMKSYTIKDIEDDVWIKFINTIPREKDINTRIKEILSEEAERHKK